VRLRIRDSGDHPRIMPDLGQHIRRIAAALFSGRQIVIGLIVLVVLVILLVGPVIGENLMNSATAGAARVAPAVFLIGLGILVLGLVAQLGVLEVAGGCLMGAVLLGAILRDY
jgi:hypothetical protein